MNDWSEQLLLAAQSRDARAVVEAIEHGAQIDIRDGSGFTPLHWAARLGDVVSLGLLIDQGADVQAKDAFDMTPLHCAPPNTDAMRLLLDRGAAINAMDKNGNTPLHEACFSGSVDTARLLLDCGADINAGLENRGRTPVYIAALCGHAGLVRLLLERGAALTQVEVTDHPLLSMLQDRDGDGLHDGHAETALVLYGVLGLGLTDAYDGKTLEAWFADSPDGLRVIRAAAAQQAISIGFADLVEAPTGVVYQPTPGSKRDLVL